MSPQKILKKTFVFTLLVYLRYLLKRYIINQKIYSYNVSDKCKLEVIDNEDVTFFGYYNISPENKVGDILYLKVKKEHIRGSLYEPASIMLRDKNGNISKIAETKAWNWQQGCMLQWFPNSNNEILFNDYEAETDRYISKKININGKVIKKYDLPINSVSKTGEYALSINYDRLAQMRSDYGYFNRKGVELPSNKKDGIWYINLNSGEVNLIITLAQLEDIKYVPSMKGAQHKVNHIDINPNGTRFIFLHRWIGPKGRFMRLISSAPDGSDIQILNGDIMTSHSCWWGTDKIISFCQTEKHNNAYMIFKDKTSYNKLLSKKLPVKDGHPSVFSDANWMITDTYPGLDRMSNLLLYNIKKDKLIFVGRFYQPLRYNGEKRIDLHPKCNTNGEKIYFESGHKRKRKLYSIDISSFLENGE